MVFVLRCVGHAIFWLFMHSYCLVKWMSVISQQKLGMVSRKRRKQVFPRFAFCRTSGLFDCVPSYNKFYAQFKKCILCFSLWNLIIHGDHFNAILRNRNTLSYVITSMYFLFHYSEVKVKERKAVTGILFVRIFLFDVKYSENESRGFPGNKLTGAVILECGNTVCSSLTSHREILGGNVVVEWIAVVAKIRVIPAFPKISLFLWFTLHCSV